VVDKNLLKIEIIEKDEFLILKNNAENISGKPNNLIRYLKKTEYKGTKYK